MEPNDEATLRAYLESQGHMPPEFRDFHDQKDLFKTIGDRDLSPHKGIKDEITWRQGMIYTVDFFLWFMAIHGYELRKIEDSGIPRKDLQEAIEARKETDAQAFRKMREEMRNEDERRTEVL